MAKAESDAPAAADRRTALLWTSSSWEPLSPLATNALRGRGTPKDITGQAIRGLEPRSSTGHLLELYLLPWPLVRLANLGEVPEAEGTTGRTRQRGCIRFERGGSSTDQTGTHRYDSGTQPLLTRTTARPSLLRKGVTTKYPGSALQAQTVS